ncbi:MAG: DUF4838 domain-containing protein [Kiritimatiellia bacterium]
MRTIRSSILVMGGLIVFLGFVPVVCQALDWVVDGKAAVTLVVPGETNVVTEQAAELLTRYVAEITGVRLQTVSENNTPVSGARVFLGATKAALAAGIDLSALKYDSFIWKTQGKDFFIAGNDYRFASAKGNNLAKSSCQGTARGIYRLLEEYGGVRWFLPTSKGLVVPKSTRFTLPDTLDRQENAVFAYTAGGVSGLGEWPLANGQRLAVDVRIQGHSWDGALRKWGDPKKLFEKDPSIFALVKGKRHYSDSNFHLCTSHPDFVEMNVRYLSSLFDVGYQWVEYNQSDGYRRCECDACNAMDQLDELELTKGAYCCKANAPNPHDKSLPPAERLWVPFHEIALRLYKKYPDRKIIPLAYGPTFIPSQQVKQFSPNVMISLTRDFPEYFEAYAEYDTTIWTYWWGTYHVSGLTPNMMAHDVAAQVRELADHGVLGVYACGGGEQWGLEGPAYYVYAKLSWNPKLDVDLLLNDYYRGIYHAAAPEMERFFNLIEARTAVGKATQTVKEKAYNDYQVSVANYFPEAYPPHILNTLNSLLATAKAKTKGDDFATQWLAFTDIQYRYLKAVANGFNLYREYRYMRKKPPELCEELLAAIADRKKLLAELSELKAKRDWLDAWFPGANVYLTKAATGGEMFGALGTRPPFSDAFKLELEKNMAVPKQ